MTDDETRPDEAETPADDTTTDAAEPEVPEVPARDDDDDPDSRAGDFTDADVDLSHLEVQPDEDGE